MPARSARSPPCCATRVAGCCWSASAARGCSSSPAASANRGSPRSTPWRASWVRNSGSASIRPPPCGWASSRTPPCTSPVAACAPKCSWSPARTCRKPAPRSRHWPGSTPGRPGTCRSRHCRAGGSCPPQRAMQPPRRRWGRGQRRRRQHRSARRQGALKDRAQATCRGRLAATGIPRNCRISARRARASPSPSAISSRV